VSVPARRIAATLVTAVLTLTAGPGLSPVPAAASPAAAAAGTESTARVQVRPVDAAGQLRAGYHVTHRHGRAHCLLGAIAVGTAYRCFAGNDHIYDPCWLQADAAHVVCLAAPWRHGVVRLHVTRGFDGRYGSAPVRPWALRLTDGTGCVRVQGAAGVVGGRGISYTCRDGETVLLGEADTSDDVWRIRTAADPTGGYDYAATGFRPVDTAYVGRRSLRP
jgi:hypothetical protein